MFDDITRTYKITRPGARITVVMELTRPEAVGEVCIECGYLRADAEALRFEPYGSYREHGLLVVVITCIDCNEHDDVQRLF